MKNKLVAYFSASGVTGSFWRLHLAEAVDGIRMRSNRLCLYSDADLNWNDAHSRSSVEMKDKTSRPAIANHVEHMEGYDPSISVSRSGGTPPRRSSIPFRAV